MKLLTKNDYEYIVYSVKFCVRQVKLDECVFCF